VTNGTIFEGRIVAIPIRWLSYEVINAEVLRYTFIITDFEYNG